eukprot:Rmarinus@m.25815
MGAIDELEYHRQERERNNLKWSSPKKLDIYDLKPVTTPTFPNRSKERRQLVKQMNALMPETFGNRRSSMMSSHSSTMTLGGMTHRREQKMNMPASLREHETLPLGAVPAPRHQIHNFPKGFYTQWLSEKLQKERMKEAKEDPSSKKQTDSDTVSSPRRERQRKSKRQSIEDGDILFDIIMGLSDRQIMEMQTAFDESPGGELDLYMFILAVKKSLALNDFRNDAIRGLNDYQLMDQLSLLFNQIDLDGSNAIDWVECSAFMIDVANSEATSTRDLLPQYESHPLVCQYAYESECKQVEKLITLEGMNPPRFLTCAKDKNVCIRNTSDGSVVRNWSFKAPCLSAVHLPEQKRIITSSSDKLLISWDSTSFSQQMSTEAPDPQLCLCPCDVGGKSILFSGGVDGVITQWNPATLATKARFTNGHLNWVLDLLFLEDVGLVASASTDKTIKLWDVSDGNCRRTLKGHTKGVSSLAYCSDLRFLVSSGFERTIYVWNPFYSDVVHRMTGHEKPVVKVHYVEGGYELISADIDGKMKVWDIRNFKCIQTLGEELKEMSRHTPLASFAVDDHLRQITTVTNKLCMWSCVDRKLGSVTSKYPITSITYNPRFCVVLVGSGPELSSWNLQQGQMLQNFHSVVEGRDVTAVGVDWRHQKIVFGDVSGTIKIFTYPLGHVLDEFQLLPSEVMKLYCHANACNVMVVVYQTGVMFVIDYSRPFKPRTIMRLNNDQLEVTATAFSSHFNLFVASFANGSLTAWRIQSGGHHATVTLPADITAMVFLDELKVLATADMDRNLYFYDVIHFQPLLVIEMPTNISVNHIAYIPNQIDESADLPAPSRPQSPRSLLTDTESSDPIPELFFRQSLAPESRLVCTDEAGVVTVWDVCAALKAACMEAADYDSGSDISEHNVMFSAARLERKIAKARKLFDAKKYEEILPILEWVLERSPNHVHALLLQGLTLYHLGKYREALASLQAVELAQEHDASPEASLLFAEVGEIMSICTVMLDAPTKAETPTNTRGGRETRIGTSSTTSKRHLASPTTKTLPEVTTSPSNGSRRTEQVTLRLGVTENESPKPIPASPMPKPPSGPSRPQSLRVHVRSKSRKGSRDSDFHRLARNEQCVRGGPEIGATQSAMSDFKWHVVDLEFSKPDDFILSRWKAHADTITSLVVVPSNPVAIVTGGFEGLVKLWSLRGELFGKLQQGSHQGDARGTSPWLYPFNYAAQREIMRRRGAQTLDILRKYEQRANQGVANTANKMTKTDPLYSHMQLAPSPELLNRNPVEGPRSVKVMRRIPAPDAASSIDDRSNLDTADGCREDSASSTFLSQAAAVDWDHGLDRVSESSTTKYTEEADSARRGLAGRRLSNGQSEISLPQLTSKLATLQYG